MRFSMAVVPGFIGETSEEIYKHVMGALNFRGDNVGALGPFARCNVGLLFVVTFSDILWSVDASRLPVSVAHGKLEFVDFTGITGSTREVELLGGMDRQRRGTVPLLVSIFVVDKILTFPPAVVKQFVAGKESWDHTWSGLLAGIDFAVGGWQVVDEAAERRK